MPDAKERPIRTRWLTERFSRVIVSPGLPAIREAQESKKTASFGWSFRLVFHFLPRSLSRPLTRQHQVRSHKHRQPQKHVRNNKLSISQHKTMGILHACITKTKRMTPPTKHALTNLTDETKKECLQDQKKKETQGSEKNNLIKLIHTTAPPLRNRTLPAEGKNNS
jgi:hypothetical protein